MQCPLSISTILLIQYENHLTVRFSCASRSLKQGLKETCKLNQIAKGKVDLENYEDSWLWIVMGLLHRNIAVSSIVVVCLISAVIFQGRVTTVTCSWSSGGLHLDHSVTLLSSDIIQNDSSESLLAHGRVLASVESEDNVDELREYEAMVSNPDPVSASEIVEPGRLALYRSLPKLYHSPEIFTLSYEEMWKQLQIWVYPSQAQYTIYEHQYDGVKDVMEELNSTTDLFFRLLLASKFSTEVPQKAQLFLLPFSINALRNDLGPSRIADHLRRYIQNVRTSHPFWDLSLGANHFYLSCQAFEQNNKHRNLLELGKNSIQAACTPLEKNQSFYPHKDFVFPQYKLVMQTELYAAFEGRTTRTALAYFSGTLADTPALVSIFDKWKSDPDFEVEVHSPPHRSSVYRHLARSKFCVTIPSRDTFDFVDAIRFGCVPVLLSKSVFLDLPFQGFLDWSQIAIMLSMEDLPDLKQKLTSISSEEYREMQYLGREAAKHLEWNNPPLPYDAFHMTLLELWERRHSIKYGRQIFNSTTVSS